MAALGPYPERGEYEHCFTLQGPRGEFVQLTPTIAEHVARAIEWAREQTRGWRAEIVSGKQREERAYEEWAFEVMDDGAPAFHAQPFVTVGCMSSRRRCQCRWVKDGA